jgi:hypothetical protein
LSFPRRPAVLLTLSRPRLMLPGVPPIRKVVNSCRGSGSLCTQSRAAVMRA